MSDAATMSSNATLTSLQQAAASLPIPLQVKGNVVVTAPATLIGTLNNAQALPAIAVADAAAPAGATFIVTLTDTAGSLAIASPGGATVFGSGTGSLTVVGQVAAVNAALANLTSLQTGTGTIAVQANDGVSLAGTAQMQLATGSDDAAALGLAGLDAATAAFVAASVAGLGGSTAVQVTAAGASVSGAVSSTRMRVSGTPARRSAAAMDDASDGPWRPIPPVGT